MSHVHENILGYDIGIQALYNRVLVQMGLACFRLGMIQECNSYLNEICGLQKGKELYEF